MRRFEKLEHRPVLIFQQSVGNVDAVVGRDPDEVLIKRSVVDRAETKPVDDEGLTAVFEIADDVSGVE